MNILVQAHDNYIFIQFHNTQLNRKNSMCAWTIQRRRRLVFKKGTKHRGVVLSSEATFTRKYLEKTPLTEQHSCLINSTRPHILTLHYSLTDTQQFYVCTFISPIKCERPTTEPGAHKLSQYECDRGKSAVEAAVADLLAVPGHQTVTARGQCWGNQSLISLSTPKAKEAEKTGMDWA